MTSFFRLFNDARMRWLVLGITAFLFLFGQSTRTRLTTDPAFSAAIAKTMADSGDFSALRFGDEPYYIKPPLLFWLAALAIKIFGPNAFAVTLFSRIFGLGCVLLTAWLGAHLYGARVGWAAALILSTTHLFFRGSATFRLDPALTFGILLALYGYFKGERKWGPAVFYLGVSIAVLAKGPPGLLPLLIAPVHAVFSAPNGSWPKQAVRWIAWSPLLLLPLSWWVYLFLTDGMSPFAALYRDLVRTKGGIKPSFAGLWTVYVRGFLETYWPWLPLALAGAWLFAREALSPLRERHRRAAAGFFLVWVGIVFASCVFKRAQYLRYVFIALPAISVMAAHALVHFAGEKFIDRLPAAVALLALIAALGLACFPPTRSLSELDQYQAIAEILDHRLGPKDAVSLVKLKAGKKGPDPELSRGERAVSLFYFGRSVQIVSLDEVREWSSKERVTLLVRRDELPKVSVELPLEMLIAGDTHILAEVAHR
jgi:4-amino-4-deoxy-L-arabinose transferase-like glycosyltransferase